MTEETDLPPITDFHRHEVLHVAYIAADVFDRHLLEHRAVQSNPDLCEKAEAISTLLWDFYQAAGQSSDEATDREAEASPQHPVAPAKAGANRGLRVDAELGVGRTAQIRPCLRRGDGISLV